MFGLLRSSAEDGGLARSPPLSLSRRYKQEEGLAFAVSMVWEFGSAVTWARGLSHMSVGWDETFANRCD